MHEMTFDSKLIENGTLFCPEEFSFKDANYKVIVSFPEEIDIFSDIEKSVIQDNSSDFLTDKEINYYLNLEEI